MTSASSTLPDLNASASTSAEAAADAAPAPATGPRKPKRVQYVSCDACRLRKVKCDRAPKIAEWRAANPDLPEARDQTYRPGTDMIPCSLCQEHGINCVLTIKPPKRRVGKRLAMLKASNAASAAFNIEDDERDSSGNEGDEAGRNNGAAPTQSVPQSKRRRRDDVMGNISLRDERMIRSVFTPIPQPVRESTRHPEDVYADPAPTLAPNLHSPPLAEVTTPHGRLMYEAALLSPQIGLFGVPRLTKSVLDACFIGFFAGPSVCPAILRYEETLPRYRAYFRKHAADLAAAHAHEEPHRQGVPPRAYSTTFHIPGGSNGASGLFDSQLNGATNSSGDGLPDPATDSADKVRARLPSVGDDIVPLPEAVIVAIALCGSGQLDKELYPFKLLLQRDLARRWKEMAFEFVHKVDLGMDFFENGADARVDCLAALDALDTLIIVGAQDFEFMLSEHEMALQQISYRSLPLSKDQQGEKTLQAEHIKYQRALLFHIRGTTLEGTFRFACKMGINRNPLNSLMSPHQPSGQPNFPAQTMSLVTRLRRTRQWWCVFSSDAFESLARRTPLLIGDHDFDVPLPSFRPGSKGEAKFSSSHGARGQAAAGGSAQAAGTSSKAAQNNAASSSSGKPVSRALPTSFDLAWTDTLFGLAFFARGLTRRFVSVRVQGQGVNVLDALNSIELLERFYRAIPDEIRWETQDAKLLDILAELYPPETAGRAAAARPDGESARESGQGPQAQEPSRSNGQAPPVRRRRVPNTLRATSKAFRDAIQSLFLESLLISVVLCIGSAVKDFGFRMPVQDEALDPLDTMEGMLSGQLMENPFFRGDQDPTQSEPRFLQTLKDDVAAQDRAARRSVNSRNLATQQRAMEDVTVVRLYTLLLRFFFRAAKVYQEGAEHGFLSARHNTFGSVAAVYALWGVQHVNDLMRANEAAAERASVGQNGSTRGASHQAQDAGTTPSSAKATTSSAGPDTIRAGVRRGMRDHPDVCRTAAADTGTSVDDAKQAVRDLCAALMTTIDSDTRVEGLVQTLRMATQPWDEAEVRELLERERHQHEHEGGDGPPPPHGQGEARGVPHGMPMPAPAPGGVDYVPGPGVPGALPGRAGPPPGHYAPYPPGAGQGPDLRRSNQWYATAPPPPDAPGAPGPGPGQGPGPSPGPAGTSSTTLGGPNTTFGPPPPHHDDAQARLRLDPFANLTQFSFGPVPGGMPGSGTGYAGGPQLPPIGHLAGTNIGGPGGDGGYASNTFEFDRAVREMLAAAAVGGGGGMGGGHGHGHAHAHGHGHGHGHGHAGPGHVQHSGGLDSYAGAPGSSSAASYGASGGGGGMPPPGVGGPRHSSAMPHHAQHHHQQQHHNGQQQQQQQHGPPHPPPLSPMTLALSSLPPLTSEQQSSMDWLASLAQGYHQ